MTTSISPNLVKGKAITRGKVPKIAQQLSLNLNFAADTIFTCNIPTLEGIKNTAGIDGIQSVYIDNSLNSTVVDIVFDFGQNVVCPPYAQAIFPIFWPGQQLNFTATSAGGVSVPVIFTNTREVANVWSAKTPLAGTVNVSGSDLFTQPYTGAFTDSSATLVTGGTSQLLLAASGTRQILGIKNPATSQGIAAPEPAFINFGAAATVGGSSWELLPGEQLPQFLMTTTQAIYWNAATTGHQIIAKYM